MAKDKDLVALYEDLLERCRTALGLHDLRETRSKLYTLLLRRPLDPRLQEVLDEFGVSASYTRTHLLSVGSWPADVQNAIRRGLPYQDARKVSQLEAGARQEVLDLFRDSHPDDAAKASRAARLRERELKHDASARQLDLGRDGWVAPTKKLRREPLPLPATVVYVAADTAAGDEALPRGVLEGLLVAYTEAGGSVVDPMAGSGSMALAARVLGRRSWSSDRAPRFPFIHAVDATDLRALGAALGGEVGVADLVLLHPPTAERWHEIGGLDIDRDYVPWIGRLVQNALVLASPGGHVAVVVRPRRHATGVELMTDAVARELAAGGERVVGYHVLVEARGTGEWHVVVGARSR